MSRNVYLTEILPPEREPLSLEEVKAHLRVTGDGEDGLIQGLIRAARAACEDYTGRALVARDYVLALDAWPARGDLRLPRPPFLSLTRIDIVGRSGERIEHPAAAYEIDGAGRIVMTGSFPAALRESGGIEVRYRAGYGDAPESVPEPLRLAMKQLVARLYERRGDGEAGALPAAVRAAFQSYRVMELS